MTQEDEGMLRDIFAGLAMNGWIISGDYPNEDIPNIAYVMADAMMEARDPKETVGLPAIKKRVRK